MSTQRADFLRGLCFLAVGAAIAGAAGWIFAAMHEPEPIHPGPGVTKTGRLSDYFPVLAGSAGETPLFVLDGETAGGTLVLLGGTHPQEVAGHVAAARG